MGGKLGREGENGREGGRGRMGEKTGEGRRGMGGWGWIAEAKLQEKGEPGEQQISAGGRKRGPWRGELLQLGAGGGRRWEPVGPALPPPDLCPPPEQ